MLGSHGLRMLYDFSKKPSRNVGLQYIYDTVMKKETEGKREENKG